MIHGQSATPKTVGDVIKHLHEEIQVDTEPLYYMFTTRTTIVVKVLL